MSGSTTPPRPDDLSTFLTARLEERRTAAAALEPGDRARVLAGCAAVQRIVEQYEEHRDRVMAYRSPRWRDAMNEQDKREWSSAEARHRVAEDTIRALASIWSDHPDYREEPS